MSDTGSLYVSIENIMDTITFSHPASNSFASDLFQKRTSELNQISINSEVNDVVKHAAERVASYNPEALAEMKKVFWEGN